MKRVLVAVSVAAVVALTIGQVSMRGQVTGPRQVAPFDGSAMPVPVPINILPTIPFLLGEVNLSTLGVNDSELTTVGPNSSASSASTSTLIVDDDLADCPNAVYTDIQSAVNAASPGDTIKVCRGTYVEQVTIPLTKDNLTLFSEGALQAIIKAPMVMLPPMAIVRVNGAKKVTIRHFTITGPGGGPCHSLEWGVRVDNGGSALITDNHITEIQDTPFSGCQNGVGVLIGRSSEAQTGSGTVVHNLIDKYQKGGVVVDGASSSAEVAYNEVIGVGPTTLIAQNGIQVSRDAMADVHHNKVSLNSYTPATVTSVGILLFQPNAATTTHHNYAFSNDDGVGLFVTNNTNASHNRSSQNHFDGVIVYDGGSTGNTISYNKAEANLEDCADFSSGAGTAGTANFWIKDQGDTENRPGLCKATPK